MAREVFYIKPGIFSLPACRDLLCLSLDDVASGSYNVTEGSTFEILSGNHSLNTMLSFTNVSDISLNGVSYGLSTIFLQENGTIQCENVSNFSIEGLKFVLCKELCRGESALKFINSRVSLSDSYFQGSGSRKLAKVRSILSQHCNITIANCTFDGNTGSTGGAIQSSKGDLVTISGSTFTGNKADSGGSIFMSKSILILDGTPGNVFVLNVVFSSGGAVRCTNCTVEMTGTNTFKGNAVPRNYVEKLFFVGGGAVAIESGELLMMSGNQMFFNNEGYYGGAIALLSQSCMICNASEVSIFLGENGAWYGGGLYVTQQSSTKCNITLHHNSAKVDGGGLYVTSRPRYGGSFLTGNAGGISLSGNFTGNTAKCGGAMSLNHHQNITLEYATLVDNFMSALCVTGSEIMLNEVLVRDNSGMLGGGIYSLNSSLSLSYTRFVSNRALSGGAMYLFHGTMLFSGATVFSTNSAERDGGALYAIGTNIHLHQTIEFTANSALNGGGVYLNIEATMTWSINTNYISSNNTALSYGGGIFHTDNPVPIQCRYDKNIEYSELPYCFMLFNETEQSIFLQNNTTVVSSYDSAGLSGHFLYGGQLDRCQLHHLSQQVIQSSYQFLKIIRILRTDTRTQENIIASKPYYLCFCDGSSEGQSCIRSLDKVVYRGQSFTVSLLAIAQADSIVSTSVTAAVSSTARLKLLQSPQYVPPHCANLTFNIYSIEEVEQVILYPEGLCTNSGQDRVTIHLTLLPCPDGFYPTQDGQCLCDLRLQEYNMICDDFVFQKTAGSVFWMGAKYVNESYQGLILYKICPVGYCITDVDINMTLQDLDMQCARGRAGVLCGRCADNYSLLIGSTKCKECSNTYLVLILPIAVAGLALVAFLSILRLTVATGMINSLILYANIVHVNRSIFFPTNSINVLTVFIAWLNLDLGFEVCFFDGMDAFASTCLQFAFPLYVWVLISLIILTSRYSITLTKLIGHNPIAVLATLLIMSYAKILNIIIEVYCSVGLDYPQNRTVTLWLKDANVVYLKSKHLVLTVVTSMILIFLFLPYTLLLLLGHKLYSLSGMRYFHWFNRLKPLLDSYYAPYKTHTRCWTGFLLLVRCALYIVFSYNSLRGTRNSLLAIYITFTATGFSVGSLIPGRIYRTLAVNILEGFAYLNLATLAAVALFQLTHKTAITYSLVGMVFATMIGVIAYHFHVLYIAKSAMWMSLKAFARHIWNCSPTSEIGSPTHSVATAGSHDIVSRTVIELREPLLEDPYS
jgi:predicted outer membrane repeat protein